MSGGDHPARRGGDLAPGASFQEGAMQANAAVLYEAKKPLVVEDVELLELYPLVRKMLVLHQRPTNHVRPPGQAAMVHAGRHLALPQEWPAAPSFSPGRRLCHPHRLA